jgi:tRNA-2-methylthio-N6-dimethylallyladenosine synthase
MTCKTYHIKTFGCQMNFSDSERMTSFLEGFGLKAADNIDQAGLVVLNTCGVRQSAEDRVFGAVHNLRKKNKDVLVIVTGCVAHRKDVQRKMKNKVDLFVRTKEFFQLDLGDVLNLSASTDACEDYFEIPPKYKKKATALVPIMTGCNNFCSYCVVPYARGREKSRSKKEIFDEVGGLNKKGCKEVLLLGQNVNSYESRERVVKFPELLNSLAQAHPNIKFRFLTSHPKDFSDELIRVVAENDNVPNEIHLPVQSGSDAVLKDMNRPYTQKHYLELIEKIKKNIPDVKITTDVIIGFPTETEKEFKETVKVFEKVGFTDAYINKYSPREETAALKLGNPISWEEKKRREKILRDLV